MVEIDNNLKKLIADLGRIQSQIPFAAARALNNTARAVQDFELGTELTGHLKLRGTWARKGTKFGVNANFARKDNQQAEVFSRAPWLDFQERGGTKSPKKMLIMPVTGGARPNELAPFKKFLKPGASKKIVFIAKKKGFFLIQGSRGREKLKLLWSFTKKSAHVRKRISFEAHGASLAAAMMPGEFLKTYEAALRS